MSFFHALFKYVGRVNVHRGGGSTLVDSAHMHSLISGMEDTQTTVCAYGFLHILGEPKRVAEQQLEESLKVYVYKQVDSVPQRDYNLGIDQTH